MTVYVDGKFKGTHQGNGFMRTLSAQTLYIGQEKNGSVGIVDGHGFFGEMSQFNIWNDVLSVSDIVSMSQSCNGSLMGSVLTWKNIVQGTQSVLRRNSTCPLAKGTIKKCFKRSLIHVPSDRPISKHQYDEKCDDCITGLNFSAILQ